MMPADPFSNTEQSIISYLQANPLEECMLDKISMGIGKSRATVLKYLGTLHAKGILDYRTIGRNKLWMVKKSPEPGMIPAPAPESPSSESRTLSSGAFEIHDMILREAELEDPLNPPETLILTVSDDFTIVFRNRFFESLFPGTTNLRDLIHPIHMVRVANALKSKRPGTAIILELDLIENGGISRPYQVTMVLPDAGGPAGCIAIIGEDLQARKRTRRHLEALLYISRAAGTARNEEELLHEAMKGIREKLVPYVHAFVFLNDMRTAYSTIELPDQVKADISPFIARCISTPGTVSAVRSDPALQSLLTLPAIPPFRNIVAIPIIEEEMAVGAILLVLDSDVDATDIENVEIIADEISSALKMQRLDRERSEYVNTLLAMNRLSGILSGARDETAVLEQSIGSVMDSLGFEMGCVYLKDESDEMVQKVQKNMPESLRTMCISGIFDGFFERAFAGQNVVYITPETPEYAALDPAVRASGVRTILILPIRIGERVEGLLNMGSREEKQYLRTSLDNIASIGLQLGVALERSRLAQTLAGTRQ